MSNSFADDVQRLIELQQQEDEVHQEIADLLGQVDGYNVRLAELRQQMREITEYLRSTATTDTTVRLTFQVSDLDGIDREVITEASTLKLGKHDSSHVRVNDPQAAGMMAVIEINKGSPDPTLTLIDLGNSPCTRLNGKAIIKNSLNVGDTIEVGYGAKIKLIKAEEAPSKEVERHPSPFEQKPQLSCRATTPDTQLHRVTGCFAIHS